MYIESSLNVLYCGICITHQLRMSIDEYTAHTHSECISYTLEEKEYMYSLICRWIRHSMFEDVIDTSENMFQYMYIYIYIYIYIYSDVSLNTAKTIHPTPTKNTKICILWCVVEYVTQSVWRYVIQCKRLSSSTTHQRIDSLWHSRDSKCVKICNTHQRLSSRYIYTYSLVCRSEQDKFSSFWYDKF